MRVHVKIRWTRAPREAARRYLIAVLGGEAGEVVNAPGGKPSLPGGPEFSVAHSGDLVLVAVSDGPPVGVDLELMRPVSPDVARFFAVHEQAELAAIADPAAREIRFYELWTAKEAYRKATGEGIAGPGALRDLPADGWALHRPRLPAGYLGAVAVLAEGAEFSVSEDASRRWSR